ncbi:MAG: hypothetical protein HQK86_08925 [Nitrospinae bacterium]|nr:hypothetical protein [Nitrospinota bacterium]MBF0634295.1 hypothetical protein [Nitrospinota bacterium]
MARIAGFALTLLSPFIILSLYSIYGYHAAFAFVAALMIANKPAFLVKNRSLLTPVTAQAGVVGGYVAIGFIWPHPLVFKLLPVVINLGLMALFVQSLKKPPSIIEAFAAQMTSKPLDGEAIAYCRSVTWVWAGFLFFDAILVCYVAIYREIWEWAFLTGFINYLLMGGLFAGEYVYRKRRFGDYDERLIHDRALKRFFKQ